MTTAKPLSLVATVFLATRIGVFIAGAFAVTTFGFDQRPIPRPMSQNILLDLPGRWDSAWYVGVAGRGYDWTSDPRTFQNIAFFPAYPMLLRTTATLLRVPRTPLHWTWVGVILSLCSFFAALLYLYSYTRERLDESTARWTVILTGTYPFAIFFGLTYTEALFMLCAIAASYHNQRGEFLKAAGWGLIAGLTRPNGLLVALLLLPAASDLVGDWRSVRGRAALRLFPAASPAVGLLWFSAYAYVQSGSALSWAAAQHSGGRVAVPFATTLANIYDQVNGSGLLAYATTHPYDVLNASAGLLLIVLAIPVGRLLGIGAAAYVLAGVLVPLAVGGLPSLGRYTSVLFPAQIYLAYKLSDSGRVLLLIIFSMGEALIAALFFTWRPMY